MIDHSDGAYSSADVDKIDYSKFPGIENFEYYTATLNKGDCLYIPLKWIHQIRSTDRNLAINFWFNYEKLLEFGNFSEACKTNQFDKARTLDTMKFGEANEQEEEQDVGEFKNFKYWLIRQINDGNNKVENWYRILVEEHLPKGKTIKEFPDLKNSINEKLPLMNFCKLILID